MATGSVIQRGKNKWELEVNLGTYVDPETGKKKRHRKSKTITAKNEKQANVELARYIAELTNDGYFEPEKVNFVDFVDNEWLPKYARKNLSHTTLDTHIRYLDIRIKPAFKYLRMDQIKSKHIMDFLDNLSEKGMRLDNKKTKKDNKKDNKKDKKDTLSGATIVYHYRILKSIFRFAKKRGVLKDDPMDNVDKPKFENEEREVYSAEEATYLLECLETEPLHWKIIIKLAITTGMRRSELLGLEFKHFDYENRVLHIRQAVTYTKEGGYQVHEIKKGNRMSKKRDVKISPTLIKPIKDLEHIRKQERIAKKKEDRWQKGKYEFLLCDEFGKPYNPRSVQHWWKRFINRHNLKYINLHALRHTAATLLINEGVHPKTISERLGHSDIRTTMNVYGHAMQKADEIATDKLDEALKITK